MTDKARQMWWCPCCCEYVAGRFVTFEERHEGCGAFVTDGPFDPDGPVLGKIMNQAQQRIAELTQELEGAKAGRDAHAEAMEWMERKFQYLRKIIADHERLSNQTPKVTIMRIKEELGESRES